MDDMMMPVADDTVHQYDRLKILFEILSQNSNWLFRGNATRDAKEKLT